MQLTPKIIMEIAHHEAVVREAYKDSVGVWTWSVGITSASGHAVERYIGKPQSMERCLEVYIWLLETRYLPAVCRAFTGHDLTDAQLAAALSFHWNTGAIERASWVKHWKEGDVAKARKAFLNWSKPKEIIPRRKAERDLFFDGKWSGSGSITEWTNVKTGGRIDWGSAKRRDVSGTIARLMNPKQPPAPPTEALKAPHKPKGGLLAFLLSLLTGGRA